MHIPISCGRLIKVEFVMVCSAFKKTTIASAQKTMPSNITSANQTTTPMTIKPKSNIMQIYISPANHEKPYTGYSIQEWNEKKNMELIGDYLKSYLDNYDVDVYLDKTDRSNGAGQYYGRPEEANRWIKEKSQSLYLALHSNAGANGGFGAYGSCAFYNSIGNAHELAQCMVTAINMILPCGSNRSQSIYKADNTSGSAMNLGELRIPYQYSITSVLVECAFHDNPKEAEFLIHNQKRIAEIIGHTLVSFYQLKRK